jgi:plasmid stabilization system protein ParE
MIISPQAQADADRIVAFLEESRSLETAIRFLNTYYARLDLIESMPEIGKRSDQLPSVRKFPADKYNMIYYQQTNAGITILRVIDSRRDPAQNPFGN